MRTKLLMYWGNMAVESIYITKSYNTTRIKNTGTTNMAPVFFINNMESLVLSFFKSVQKTLHKGFGQLIGIKLILFSKVFQDIIRNLNVVLLSL